VPRRYHGEFRANADWLKWGYHGYDANIEMKDVPDCERSFSAVRYAIYDFAGAQGFCRCIRLHCWSATAEQVAYLKNQGIDTLLCADNGTVSYDLSRSEAVRLAERRLTEKNGMIYRKTDFRYEHDGPDAIWTTLLDCETVTLFTHEWCFMENAPKTEESLLLLAENNFEFCAW
jgi:hypothetical protein